VIYNKLSDIQFCKAKVSSSNDLLFGSKYLWFRRHLWRRFVLKTEIQEAPLRPECFLHENV